MKLPTGAATGKVLCWPVFDDVMAPSIKRDYRVMVEKGAPASEGQVVLASVNGEEPVIRRYGRSGDLVVLRADNAAYAPISAAASDVRIIGKVGCVQFWP